MSVEPRVSILITNFNDIRVIELIKSLIDIKPLEIIVADGGSNEGLVKKIKEIENDVVRFYDLPGNVAETRYQSQKYINGDITVFIDTDEKIVGNWYQSLIDPILNDVADFTFGSTIPFKTATNRFARYQDTFDSYFYDNVLPNNISMGPMGNSAWKTEIIKNIGFDPCLGMGGEDYDLTIRALKAGYKGIFVKEAVLKHDQSSIDTFRKFITKRYHYQLGAAQAYKKNGLMNRQSVSRSARTGLNFSDPLEIVIFFTKIIAFISSFIIDPWNDPRYCNKNLIKKSEL